MTFNILKNCHVQKLHVKMSFNYQPNPTNIEVVKR